MNKELIALFEETIEVLENHELSPEGHYNSDVINVKHKLMDYIMNNSLDQRKEVIPM